MSRSLLVLFSLLSVVCSLHFISLYNNIVMLACCLFVTHIRAVRPPRIPWSSGRSLTDKSPHINTVPRVWCKQVACDVLLLLCYGFLCYAVLLTYMLLR